MNTIPEWQNQLKELTIKLTGMIAERLHYWSQGSDPQVKKHVQDLIENNLPTILVNTIQKTPSLHSASGVEYFEKNLESMADAYAKKFIGKE